MSRKLAFTLGVLVSDITIIGAAWYLQRRTLKPSRDHLAKLS